MSAPFEADLSPATGNPRLRMNYDNGWTVSVVLGMPNEKRTSFGMASVAAWPTGFMGGNVHILAEEASPDEVVAHITEVMGRLPVGGPRQ